MSMRLSLVGFVFFSGVVVATSVGCGGGGEAAALCEKEDACGNTPSDDEIAACKKQTEQCPDEADDLAACADGNLECVDDNSTIKSGKCESETGAYLACALGSM